MQDAIPSGVAVTGITKLTVSTFKTDLYVHVVDDFQGLLNGIIAERRDVEHNYVQTTNLGGLGNGYVFHWEVGILAENTHVFLQYG